MSDEFDGFLVRGDDVFRGCLDALEYSGVFLRRPNTLDRELRVLA